MGSGFLRLSATDSQKLVKGGAIGLGGLIVAMLAYVLQPQLADQPELLLSMQALAGVAINAGRKLLIDSRSEAQRSADDVAAMERRVADLKAELRLAELKLQEVNADGRPRSTG